jgi:hypothetical protein
MFMNLSFVNLAPPSHSFVGQALIRENRACSTSKASFMFSNFEPPLFLPRSEKKERGLAMMLGKGFYRIKYRKKFTFVKKIHQASKY